MRSSHAGSQFVTALIRSAAPESIWSSDFNPAALQSQFRSKPFSNEARRQNPNPDSLGWGNASKGRLTGIRISEVPVHAVHRGERRTHDPRVQGAPAGIDGDEDCLRKKTF
jgi:hypothetical protein